MKKRLLKKKNRNRILDILNNIKSEGFNIKEKSLGNGYFIFTFEPSSVCHFKLKEFPDWKFGIWLEKDKFSIFGENSYMIDKFKPSASILSFESVTSVSEFISELKVILSNTDEEWNEYLSDAQKAKERDNKIHNINFKTNRSILNAIEEFNKDNPEVQLRLKDRKSKYFVCHSRYIIEIYLLKEILEDNNKFNYYAEKAYKFLSSKKYYEIGVYGLEEYSLENLTLYSEQEYSDNQKRYSWKETLSEYIDNIKRK